jgi:nucleoside-diphosphate-sugar epimerase
MLVTGASGFIGARVAERLHARGHTVALLLKSPRPGDRAAGLYSNCELMRGDLNDPASYAEAVRAYKADTVIHAAWAGVDGGRRNEFLQVGNITAAARLLEECIAAGARHFVGIGSQAEYGPHEIPLTETVEARPTTLYGCSKLAACQITQTICRMANARHAWIRIFSTYGPRDNPNWLIPGIIRKLLKSEVPPLTAGEQQWDFLFVDDAADAIVAVAETAAAFGVFNLGSGESPSLRQTITMLRDLINSDLELGFGQVPYRPDQVMFLKADIGRLMRTTGWSPKVDLQTGLKQTVQWFSENCRENA